MSAIRANLTAAKQFPPTVLAKDPAKFSKDADSASSSQKGGMDIICISYTMLKSHRNELVTPKSGNGDCDVRDKR